jgi:hypothetical protein
MRIYRVVISFMKDQLHFQSERGVAANTPGHALDAALLNLGVKISDVDSLKTIVERADSLECFGYDAQHMICLNTSRTVVDVWRSGI